MSAGGNDINRVDGITSLEDRMEELTLHRANSYTSAASPGVKHATSSLPYTVNGIADLDSNGYTIGNKSKLISILLYNHF